MTAPERRKLGEVQADFRVVEQQLRLRLSEKGPNADVESALESLERTYLLRFWTVAESILRDRFVVAYGYEPSGLRHSVQALLGRGAGAERTLDPADTISRTEIEWSELMTRDRNLLAHAEPRDPSLWMEGSGKLVEAFLHRIGKTGAPPI